MGQKTICYDLIEKLRAAGAGEEAELQILREEKDPAYLDALSPNRENLLEWYPWKKSMSVLMLGAGYGAACGMLAERVGTLDVKDSVPEELEVLRFRYPKLLKENGGNIGLIRSAGPGSYDAVVVLEITPRVMRENTPGLSLRTLPGEEEKEEDTAALAEKLPLFLRAAASYLRTGGTLFFLAENTWALRFLTGAEKQKDHIYTSNEALSQAAAALPFAAGRRYYPLPDGKLTKDIFSDSYLPGNGDFRGISEPYEAPRYLMCSEEAVYGKLCVCGAFPSFAPAYWTVLSGYEEARAEEKNPDPIYIRYNRTRLPAYRTRTEILQKDGVRTVRKTALSKAANEHILSLEGKYRLLQKDTGVSLLVQEPQLAAEKNGVYSASFAYLEGTPVSEILAEGIADGKAPVSAIKSALERILGVGVHECHNMDCLFENIMQCGEDWYYLDYEWVFEHALDRSYLTYRMLRYWYEAYRESLYAYRDLNEFLALFGIREEDLPELLRMEESFQQYVHGDGQQSFVRNYIQDTKTISEMHAVEARLAEFTDWNLRLQDEVEEHKETIAKDIEVMRLTQNHVLNIEKANRIHERDISNLLSELTYLRKHESLLSRIGRTLRKSVHFGFPEGSRKQKLLNYVLGTFRHPVCSFRMYLSEEGRNRIAGDFAIGGEYSEGGRLKLPDCLHYADFFRKEEEKGTKEPDTAPQTNGVSGNAFPQNDAQEADGQKTALRLSNPVRPKVSIILPAYNQVAYTYACVRSIIEHTDFSETPYEVILADDVSQDATASIGKFIEGLVISRNTENQGFLKNCNQAAKKALGDYIFFLNNDTKVTDGWLSSLVQLMDGDETIGLAGSKLVYPDGRLQEAGGIIWSDASGWNYGRLDDPDKPEYNYVKEVDYISGAAIMIRRPLWEEIGGFDERFAPAYCEDSDLAFEVRKHKKRVVYQPKSVVVHYEGISNGTDVNGTGLKKYQLVNQEKFKEKWRAELKKQSKNNGNPNPFAARDRSQKKPCVLVVDHYVPTWDRDAGSRTTYQYIRMFLKKGFQVKFLGDNFLHEEPYSTQLLQMGVEILYGEAMQRGIWDWIKKNESFIDIAYLNRPHISVKYIDFLRENTGIKCIYYGHDLHFLRLMREYELSKDIRVKREADYWKSIEFGVMRKCDMSYYPSEAEAEAIHAIDPAIRVKAITAYVWDEFLPENEAAKSAEDYAKREGLLFVGGFAHPPNEDGLLWFAREVFPRVRTERPDMRLYVAGSHATDAVKALGQNAEETGISVLGFVSDEELSALYRRTKLTVVPLRYGAGVKGKVVEAVYHASVAVTTSIGAEGIPEADRVLAVVNTQDSDIAERPEEVAAAFAEAILKLYADNAVCAAISAETQRYIREHYSLDAAWTAVETDFSAEKRQK